MLVRWIALVALLLTFTTSSAVRAEPSPAAEAYLSEAMSLLRHYHINSAGADWPRIEAQARERIFRALTAADTYPAIRGAIAALGENHSGLIEPRPPLAAPAQGADPGAAANGSPLPTW